MILKEQTDGGSMSLGKSERHKLTIIVGAGGSTPFLSIKDSPLTTRLIAEALREDQRWKDVWKKFDSQRHIRDSRTASWVKDKLELDEAFVLRDMLLRTLIGTRFCESNFEYLIHLMDKTSYYLLAQRQYHQGVTMPVDQILQLDALLLGIEGTLHLKFPESHSDGWRYVPFLSREVVLETVIHAWNDLQGSRKEEVLELHRKFLRKAIQEYDQVRIYSLNYDPLLLEAIRPLAEYSTGFLDSGRFAPHEFGNTPGSLALFHGSAGFVTQENEIMLRTDYNAAQKERINDVVIRNHIGTFTSKGLQANTYLVTGLGKSDHLTLSPYTTYLHRFAIDALDSDVICVIGWSFGDDYIKAFLTNLALERPRQQVVVVNRKTKQELLSAAESEDKFLFDLAATTGDSFPYPSLPFQHLAEDVRKSGFGQFSDHTWFYGKGTKDFYDEAFDRKLL